MTGKEEACLSKTLMEKSVKCCSCKRICWW